MNQFTSGIEYLVEGFKLISKPGLRRYVIIPLLINTILFIGLFFLLRYGFHQFDQWFTQLLPKWLEWLSTVLWMIFIASFFIIILYTYVTFANLVSAPFNSFLAEQVELYLTGTLPEQRSLWDNIKDIPRIVGRQLAIIGYYLPRALLIFVLFFIPVVQTFAAVFSFLFHAWFMTLTYIDYPTDNHRVSMRDVRSWLDRRRYVGLGFGIGVLICSMVPIINCLVIPAAVAGATKLWIEEG